MYFGLQQVVLWFLVCLLFVLPWSEMSKYCHYCVTWIVVNLTCHRTHSVLLGRQPYSSALRNIEIIGKQIKVDYIFSWEQSLSDLFNSSTKAFEGTMSKRIENLWMTYLLKFIKEQNTTMLRMYVIIPPSSIALCSCGMTVIGALTICFSEPTSHERSYSPWGNAKYGCLTALSYITSPPPYLAITSHKY